ncbi:MAG: aminotransferase class I/II-fold pyridoxal phosphate-dependent enzyme [Clostridia bacterium]|nr:aminotransferase class I/II-fold pyridoxal phosphate-dependent enzyme [Clostridia bacterium]
MHIQFSPPDISDLEIEEVIKAFRSGWITTGPKTKLFEQKIAEFCGTSKAVCLNSATAALEMVLRILGVGPGDEVITSVYTYTASASTINHVGAKIVFVDTAKDSYEMDYEQLAKAITEKTKVIVPVDIGGVICDYEKIYEIIESKKQLFTPSNDIQKAYGRIIVSSDAAHSFGATRNGKKAGSFADFTSFSFHAVKNLTTAEGGAVTWRDNENIDNEFIYKEMMLWSLHGQSKDALNKMKLGSWEYDIVYPGYKCNMTDLTAAFGLAQLQRFEGLLARRNNIYKIYNRELEGLNCIKLEHDIAPDTQGNCHLYLLRINGIDENHRREIIAEMAEQGIACNVHFKPLAMMTAYKDLGYDIKDYPNAYAQYANEITLPMHTLLTDEEAVYVAQTLRGILEKNENSNKSESLSIVRVWDKDTDLMSDIARIYKECGEKMFLEEGLLHWADALSVSFVKDMVLKRETYVVRKDNKSVAFFTFGENNSYFTPDGNALFIGKMATTPELWNSGIGTFCIDWIKAEAKKREKSLLRTTVYQKSVSAVRFLSNRGFKKVYERSSKHFVVDCLEMTL